MYWAANLLNIPLVCFAVGVFNHFIFEVFSKKKGSIHRKCKHFLSNSKEANEHENFEDKTANGKTDYSGFFAIISRIFKWYKTHGTSFLTIYILLSIGLKGGAPLVDHLISSPSFFFLFVAGLVLWGFLHPFLSFYLLRMLTKLDPPTAAAVSASFGSISIMTMITAISFLDLLQVNYEKFVIAILAIMEIPAILSGLILANMHREEVDIQRSMKKSVYVKLIKECLLNKVILALAGGLLIGAVLCALGLNQISQVILWPFQMMLCLFMFQMGMLVCAQRSQLASFSFSLFLFGLLMPLFGGGIGLLFSSLFGFNAGTGALIAVLLASASYIAVPAAMRLAVPLAKEAVYLPLSLGVVFPFNVLIGIPLYYCVAQRVL
ncbi:MAG: sodium-dependent bicarbonate transport family permease [Verrucomicrobia bacterium]|nr:sodium-dependent bicarbonate transport family permease [Verrucomicrobiota bacterium]